MATPGQLHRPAANHQKWVRGCILAIGAVVVLAYSGLDPLLRKSTKRDRLQAVPKEGVATVVDRRDPKLDDYDRPIPASVIVRFQGHVYPTEAVFGFSELKMNQPAHIVYRVGKSGRLYIDRVEPLLEPVKKK